MQCGPCRSFTPQLVKTYNKVKQSGKKFEILFCSSDREEDSFQEYYATMPWIALPYGDNRKKSLSRFFDVSGKCSWCIWRLTIALTQGCGIVKPQFFSQLETYSCSWVLESRSVNINHVALRITQF